MEQGLLVAWPCIIFHENKMPITGDKERYLCAVGSGVDSAHAHDRYFGLTLHIRKEYYVEDWPEYPPNPWGIILQERLSLDQNKRREKTVRAARLDSAKIIRRMCSSSRRRALLGLGSRQNRNLDWVCGVDRGRGGTGRSGTGWSRVRRGRAVMVRGIITVPTRSDPYA